ncbi:MAG: hypothetical protein AAFX05_07250 [Planctomycetota bacterium]
MSETIPPHEQVRPLPLRSLGWGLAMVTGLAAAAAAACALIRTDVATGVALGSASALAGVALGGLVIGPWQPRQIARWPMLLLGAQGISVFGSLLIAALLYFAAQPPKAAFAASAGGTFILCWIVLARVLAAWLPTAHAS